MSAANSLVRFGPRDIPLLESSGAAGRWPPRFWRRSAWASYLLLPGLWRAPRPAIALQNHHTPTTRFRKESPTVRLTLDDYSAAAPQSQPSVTTSRRQKSRILPTELTTDTLQLDSPTISARINTDENDPFEEAGGGMGGAALDLGVAPSAGSSAAHSRSGMGGGMGGGKGMARAARPGDKPRAEGLSAKPRIETNQAPTDAAANSEALSNR